MPPDGVIFTPQDAARMWRAVRFVERLSREQLNVTPSTGVVPGTRGDETVVWFAVCTGEILSEPEAPYELAGLHAGRLYVPDPATGSRWRQSDCWLRPLPGSPLETGAAGVARLVGYTTATLDPGSGSGSGEADAQPRPIYTIVPSDGGDGSGAAPCVEWYSIYLHMQVASVGVGEIVGPRQQVGQIGPYVGAPAHAHVAIGDGIPLAAPNGFPIAGQSIDIASWPGLPIVGEHVGIPPSGVARFSTEQVAAIQAHFGLPVDESLPWTVGIGSEAHDLWDYYAIDLVLLDDPDYAIGQPVYAAFVGDDVRTTCVYAENLGDNYQWIVILKHQIGDCAPCPPSRVVCEDGYLRRERCGPDGQWEFEEDLGVPCDAKKGSGSGSGGGPGPGGSGPNEKTPVKFESVSRVCVHRAGVTTLAASATLTGDETVVHVDASAGAVTVTLLDPAEVASPPAPVTIKKVDASANAVTINAVGGDVELGSSLTLSARGDWHSLYTDGTDWFVGVAPAIAGITVESQHVQVRAPGYVSDPVCLDDPEECCAPRDTGLPCCPDGSRDVLNGSASGPIGIAGAEIEFLMVLERDGDGSWFGSGWLGVASGEFSPGAAVMDGNLYCTSDENGELVWQLSGSVTNGDGTTAQYRIDLADEGDGYLTGVITFPANSEPIPVVIEHPCQSGPCCPVTVSVPLDFTAGGAIGPSGAEVTFEGSLEHVDGTVWNTGTPQDGDYPGTSITIELGCSGGWKATGVITRPGADAINYVVWLEDQGAQLYGEINLPGSDDVFVITIETPCAPESGDGSSCAAAIHLALDVSRHDCRGGYPDPGVWYKFVAPSTGSYNLQFQSDTAWTSDYPVYTECGGTRINPEAANSGGTGPEYTFAATAGQAFWINIKATVISPSDCYTIRIEAA